MNTRFFFCKIKPLTQALNYLSKFNSTFGLFHSAIRTPPIRNTQTLPMHQYNLLGFIILILDNPVKFAKQNVGKQRRTGI